MSQASVGSQVSNSATFRSKTPTLSSTINLVEEVEKIAEGYLEDYASGKIDRLDVVYTQFKTVARQETVVETLLPLGSLIDEEGSEEGASGSSESLYEFVPSPESILEEVVPMSFKVKLFKCFLDAAVSEQIARMVAMKSATENASDMIRNLSQTSHLRQSQITGEIMEVIGGVEAFKANRDLNKIFEAAPRSITIA